MLNKGYLLNVRAGPRSAGLQRVLRQLPEDGPEAQAIRAGEIDAVVDYANSNVIVFPAARQALMEDAKRGTAGKRETAIEAPVANSLLAALPRADYLRLLPALEPAALRFGDVLHEPGAPIRYVYFPVDCVVCLLMKSDSQRAVEVALVGHEGMVGVALALGVDVASVRAQVQTAGMVMRMPAARFQDEFRRCLPLQRELYRYMYVKITQARQTAACIASHLFEPRLACWLLMTSDRSRSPQILLTHEYLATIFNVRRVTVTLAAAAMRSRKLIAYNRGMIRIVNRKGLEAASCSCYRKIEALHAT
jgi:CRP-like cAMP-binding protein